MPYAVDPYELNPSEFERLVASILTAQGFDVELGESAAQDIEVDLVASKDGKRIPVEVVHAKQIRSTTVERVARQFRAIAGNYDEFWFVTSALVPQGARLAFARYSGEDLRVRIVDRDELRLWMKEAEAQRLKQFLDLRGKMQSRALSHLRVTRLAAVGLFVSGLGFAVSAQLWTRVPRQMLGERIENVERAINALKDLEKQLSEIRTEMAETERATKAIEAEYSRAKELEKITNEQIEAMRSALQRRTRWQVTIELSSSFLLGVVSSIAASEIYRRFRTNRSLNAEE